MKSQKVLVIPTKSNLGTSKKIETNLGVQRNYKCYSDRVVEIIYTVDRYNLRLDLTNTKLVNSNFSEIHILFAYFKEKENAMLVTVLSVAMLLISFYSQLIFIGSFISDGSTKDAITILHSNPFCLIFPGILLLSALIFWRSDALSMSGNLRHHPILAKKYPIEQFCLVYYYPNSSVGNSLSPEETKDYLLKYHLWDNGKISENYIAKDKDIIYEENEDGSFMRKNVLVRSYVSNKRCLSCKKMMPHSIQVGDDCPNCNVKFSDERISFQ